MEYEGEQQKWKVRKEAGSETLGPLTLEEMQELYSAGELDETSRVYEPSLDSWEPLWRVDELINRLSESPSSAEATSQSSGPSGHGGSGAGSGRRGEGGMAKQSSTGTETGDQSAGEVRQQLENPGEYTGAGYGDMQPTVGSDYHGYPPEIQNLSWNWGGFLLSLLWGVSHRHWWALLILVPGIGNLAGLGLGIYYGLRGYEIAWDSGRFSSADECIACQRHWLYWGIGLYLLLIGLSVFSAVTGTI